MCMIDFWVEAKSKSLWLGQIAPMRRLSLLMDVQRRRSHELLCCDTCICDTCITCMIFPPKFVLQIFFGHTWVQRTYYKNFSFEILCFGSSLANCRHTYSTNIFRVFPLTSTNPPLIFDMDYSTHTLISYLASCIFLSWVGLQM